LFTLVACGIVVRSRAPVWARGALLAVMIASGLAFARPRGVDVKPLGPRVTHDEEYVGSGACRSCHPSEHASWSRTYHRTMTQRGVAPIAITTGSHHMQGYWTEDSNGDLHMLPLVFARDEGRLIDRRDAFLEPPDAPQHDVRWSSNCIACHATAGRPGIVDNEPTRTTAAELGIACEACHGAGHLHAERERNPLVRAFSGLRDAHIVNPARLPPERASAVCGSCHAYAFPRDERAFLTNGYADAFHPGDALEPSRIILTPEVLAKGTVKLDTDPRNLFWPDGTVRVGGREYNGMVLSACYARGDGERKITCMSCHSMHRSDPDDQLKDVQAACVSCHAMPADHTHHAPGSSGSACVGCHMPKTSYALRYAIRSHRIDVPDPAVAKPNACNLCHLDRTVTWTASEIARLWGTSAKSGTADTNPASVTGLLAADAAERVIWADAFGDRDAIAASGDDWEGVPLAAAENDPYAVIRFIAHRSRLAYHSPGSAPQAAEQLRPKSIDALVAHRDNRDVYVAE
jgi:predicted CXXCH cytochrome family protein